jgi:hypothetical protein
MRIQEWIHQLDVGSGARYVRLAVVFFGFLALALLYNLFEYRNLANPEAMDAAQLARNVARGEGFTTQFVRPLSLRLVEQHQMARGILTNDFGLINAGHPDLANPPLYPLVLAGAMRVLPFRFEIPRGRQNRQYQPDLLIALVNQALFLALAILTFRLAARLFDAAVAWGAVIALVGSELLWRFTVSGLPTLLLSNIFVLLVTCLATFERRAREPETPRARLIWLGLGAGLLVGLGALTRYSFGWLIFPVGLFLAVCAPRGRVAVAMSAVLVFLAVLTPWLARNYHWSGTLFGTAGYAAMAEIYPFESDTIQRSLEVPSTESSLADAALRKLLVHALPLLQEQVVTLGGSWLSAFFLVGLLVSFVDPGRNRLRWFLVGAAALFLVAQAMGRTELSAESTVNGENLLVLLAPVVFIFGMALFTTLLDQLPLTFFRAREVVTAAFLVLLCLPLLMALLPPRRNVLAFPPYHPLYIQTMTDWMEKHEMIMGDLPWATAWYGDHLCVWLSLNLSDPKNRNDFYAINDFHRPVRALHLSRETLDKPMMTGLDVYQDRGSWGHFVFGLVQARYDIRQIVGPQGSESGIPEAVQKRVGQRWARALQDVAPASFPLRFTPLGHMLQGQLFLTDRARWAESRR